jgi:hypothetical protein
METERKGRARLLRFLARGEAKIVEASANKDILLLDGGDRGTVSVEKSLVADMLRDRSAVIDDGALRLAPEMSPDDRRFEIGAAEILTADGPTAVAINLSESPLAQLMRRKDRNGRSFLTQAEFRAGERLRADFTRGQIMPRLGANWEASVSSGRRSGGIADLTDAALAARLRVEKAMNAVGPELSGLLIDVCCFLKGMETVEIERGWPVRSAKIVLKTALGVLSRHYHPDAGQRRKAVLHWGAEDYRPTIV